MLAMRRSLHWPFRKPGSTTPTESRNEDAEADRPATKRAPIYKGEGGSTWSTKASDVTNIASDADTIVDIDQEAGTDTPYGLEELVGQPTDRVGCVDIVAIHGLNGHRRKTWTDRTTGLNWLKDEDCLRKDIPNARVLTFGYNSRTYFSRSDPDIRDFASELLIALKAVRRSRTEQQRPIVFLCHSLGGLVFKQAVIRAHEQNEHYSGILGSIRGVVFFATPHRGSDLAFWDRIGTSLVRVGTFGYLTNTKLSKDLKVNSEMLRRISDSFAYRGGTFKIRSFYETQPMVGLNCRVVERESATLGWPNELDIASSAHHSNICKFPTPMDKRYQTAIFAISELISHSGGDSKAEDDSTFSPREEACMKELNSDYEHHLGQVDDAVPGTCEWVLSHNKWRQWNSLKDSALLWITADAGCGKSVIAKFLVNHFLTERSSYPRRHICYFFFKDGFEDQDNASAAISAVLQQLCCSQRQLIKHVMTKYTCMPKRIFQRFSSLWPILMTIMQDPSMRDVIWILDGLDECERKSLDELLKALSMFFDSWPVSTRGACLKIILLSRPHNSIQQRLHLGGEDDVGNIDGLRNVERGNKMRLPAEEETTAIARDIAIFARSKIAELGQTSELSQDVLCRLEDRLISGADFTFLWISLVIKLVEDTEVDGISLAQLESILRTTDLDDVYENLLSGRTLPLKTRKALMLVLGAVRPLTLKEMCTAIEVYQDYYPRTSDDVLARSRLAEYTAADLAAGKRKPPSAAKTGLQQAELTQLVEGEDNEAMKAQNTSHGRQPATVKDQLSGGDSNGPAHAKSPFTISSLEELGMVLHKPFSNHLRQICGHFLRIRGRKVYLVHQTAREFLLDKQEQVTQGLFSLAVPQPVNHLLHHQQGRRKKDKRKNMPQSVVSHKSWKHSIRLKDANGYLLQVCADYIGLFEFDIPFKRWRTDRVIKYLKNCRDDPPRAFFKYAAFHWVDHYRPVRQSLDFSFDYLLNPSGRMFRIWIIVHRAWIPEEERSKLEAGGVQIAPDAVDSDEDPRLKLFYAAFKSSDKKAQEIEGVLDHFNLSLNEETEVYDMEFLAGDRYWKKQAERDVNDYEDEDDEDDEVDEDRTDDGAGAAAGDVSGRIPHRIQFYRRQNRRDVVEALEEMRNPLSASGGNPTSLYSGDMTFSVLKS